jgi:hypothetical protein
MRLTDSRIQVDAVLEDGAAFETGAVLAEVTGPARAVLQAERVGLNFVQRMSGIATLTVPVGKGGRYLVTYNGKWSASAGSGGAWAVVNGTTLYEFSTAGGIAWAPVITFLRTFVAGDTLKFQVFQSSGSNKDITSGLEIAPA